MNFHKRQNQKNLHHGLERMSTSHLIVYLYLYLFMARGVAYFSCNKGLYLVSISPTDRSNAVLLSISDVKACRLRMYWAVILQLDPCLSGFSLFLFFIIFVAYLFRLSVCLFVLVVVFLFFFFFFFFFG